MDRRFTMPRGWRLRVMLASCACLTCLALPFPVAAQALSFDPELIITNDNLRDFDSMSAARIQGFLETQTGPLASLVTTDHTGVRRRASAIIARACVRWRISPKVMLTMLQKEQSLLTSTWYTERTLSRAVGAGCPDANTNRYPGFGRQIWNGARLLDGYGEGRNGTSVPRYFPGIRRQDIYQRPKVTIRPRNIATYKLYVYNPSIGATAPYGDLSGQAGRTSGNANFWLVYRRHFGDPLKPPASRRVFRFRNRATGAYLYTASAHERHRLETGAGPKRWVSQGAVFSVDSSVPATATVPLHRFRHRTTGRHSFVTSPATYAVRLTAAGRRAWEYEGVAFRVSRVALPGATPVHRFRNRTTGGVFLTASLSTRDRLRSVSMRRLWSDEGVAFHLLRMSEPSSLPAGSGSGGS